MLKKIGISGLLILFLSCSMSRKDYFFSPNLPNSFNSAVAVLPFDNASTDISAEKFLRDMVAKRFVEKGWTIIPNDKVDEKLQELGISDGGQLAAFKSQDIANKIGARILCYGYIEDFKFQNLGFIINKKVTLNIKLVDGISGENLFEATGNGSDTKIYTNKDEAKEAFLVNSAIKLAGNILNKPLLVESEKAVDEIFKLLKCAVEGKSSCYGR